MARQNSKDKGVKENPIGSGIWWIDCYVSGKRFRKRVGAKTAAKVFYQKVKTEEWERRLFPEKYTNKRGTFSELAGDVINDYKVNGKKSHKRAQENIETLQEFFGNCHASDITTDKIQGYIIYRKNKGLSNGTINRELKILHRMFSLASKRTPPKVTSIPYIPHLEENNARTGFFDHDDFLVLKAVLPDYAKLPVTIAYYTGMRIGEILNLKWNQVDFTEGKIVLSPIQTKNKTSRTIYLYGELYDIIFKAWEVRQWHYQDCPWVCQKDGKQIKSIRSAWDKAVKKVGLTGMLIHDLRRTAIRNMVRSGISENVAMMISGHKTRSVFDRYNICSELDLKNAALKMNTFFRTDTKTDTSNFVNDVSH